MSSEERELWLLPLLVSQVINFMAVIAELQQPIAPGLFLIIGLSVLGGYFLARFSCKFDER